MGLLDKLKLDAFRKNIVVPSVTRMGTLIAGWIIGQGIPSDHAHAVGLGVAGAALIAFDLTVSWFARRALEKSVVNKVLNDKGPL